VARRRPDTPPRHRGRAARALAVDETDLWPEVKPVAVSENPVREITGAYPTGLTDPNIPDRQELLDTASERIELLDLTLHHLLTRPGVIDQLAARPAAGVAVRILLGDPGSFWAMTQDQDDLHPHDPNDHEDEGTGSQREHQLVRELLEPLLAIRGVEVREFVAQRFNSMIRVDEQMLLTLHTHATPTTQAPTLLLRRGQEGGLFDRFAAHFQRIWEDAEPLDPEPGDYLLAPAHATDQQRAPTPAEAQAALDRLRAHQRQ
jgi:hypothetical protein